MPQSQSKPHKNVQNPGIIRLISRIHLSTCAKRKEAKRF